MTNRTIRRLDTALLAKTLGMLASEHDGQVLVAARQATRMIREAGSTWADILPEPPASAASQPITDPRGIVWLPPIGNSWRETARFIFPRATDLGRQEQQLVTAVATQTPLGRWQTPDRITPEIAETLTMIYRRIAGLPT
jgi:hypothetical protein